MNPMLEEILTSNLVLINGFKVTVERCLSAISLCWSVCIFIIVIVIVLFVVHIISLVIIAIVVVIGRRWWRRWSGVPHTRRWRCMVDWCVSRRISRRILWILASGSCRTIIASRIIIILSRTVFDCKQVGCDVIETKAFLSISKQIFYQTHCTTHTWP